MGCIFATMSVVHVKYINQMATENKFQFSRLSSLATAKKRSRATNYINLAKNIVDTYPNGLAHGLQKDAIQNGWDALPSNSHKRSYW